MPIVYFTGFISSNSVPPEIRPYVDDYQWQMIHQRVQAIEGTAHAATCCCEIILCLLIAGPFIFLCHPCIYGCCAAARKPRELERLNQALFNGSPVLGWSDVRYTFNTDLVQPRAVGINSGNGAYGGSTQMTTIVLQPAGPPVASVSMINPQVGGYAGEGTYAQAPEATPVGEGGYGGGAYGSSSTAYDKVPTSASDRQLMVQIPSNAVAGQVLTVQAPNGTILQVTIQSNHKPGENIIVNY